jgi:hypothetical protein
VTSPSDISTEVESISAVIRHARDVLDAEGLIDVSPIEARVNKLCGRLDKLRGKEGAAFQPRILALVDEFSQLDTMIETRLDNLMRTDGRAQALTAYGQAARSDKPKG